MSVWFETHQSFRDGACANLRHNSEEINEADRNANEATNLADAVTNGVDGHQP